MWFILVVPLSSVASVASASASAALASVPVLASVSESVFVFVSVVAPVFVPLSVSVSSAASLRLMESSSRQFASAHALNAIVLVEFWSTLGSSKHLSQPPCHVHWEM